jgi:RNA polymerase sigma-70 factor (ECF subfamily)
VKAVTVQDSDEELMARVQRGEARAMTLLYQRYSPTLLAFYRRMVNGERELAEDLLQETFIRLIDRAGLFDTQRKFSTWLYCIACNLCKNVYRSRRTRRGEETIDTLQASGGSRLLATTADPSDEVSHTLLSEAVFLELEKLDAGKRSLFLLRFQQELSIREIAEITGLAEGTVKSRLFYITKALAGRLAAFRPIPQRIVR